MWEGKKSCLDNVQGLVHRSLGIEGESGIDLGGDLAGDDLENPFTELDEEEVECPVNLLVD